MDSADRRAPITTGGETALSDGEVLLYGFK